MADGSWDNGGIPAPKQGLPLWGKIAIGCGVAMLLFLGSCVVGGVILSNRIKKDPEGFKKQMMGFAIDKIRPDWDDFRAVVDQLRTPEGCKALYSANPDLAKTWPTEADFLEASKAWQKDLQPLPELTPDLLEHGGIQLNRQFGGQVHASWRPKQGPDVSVTFEGPRRSGDHGPRRIVELKVR
jgi:hypothetical protein